MRYLKVKRVLALHKIVIERSGGLHGLRDKGALLSAIAQPRMTFDQVDLYPTLADKAAALCYSLVQNHPFFDGNKRIGQAAMEEMLIKNGYEIAATVDEQEQIILEVASSQRSRESLTEWLAVPLIPFDRAKL
jgi:death-on-curing protein